MEPDGIVGEKSVKEILDEKKKKEDELKGYDADSFLWYGSSIPDCITAMCLMCESKMQIEKKRFLSHSLPTVCPECERKALGVYDGEKITRYVNYSLEEHDLFLDQYNEAYSLHNNGRRRIIPVDGEDMKRVLSIRLKNPNQISTAQVYMGGLAARSHRKYELFNRICEHEGAIWIDASTQMGEAIRIDSSGWKIVDSPPILFRHHSHMKPLIVEPGTKEDFDKYLRLMNMSSEEDKILFSGYAASLFFPKIDHPILMPIGSQGSAKSTMSILAKNIIDPSEISLQTMPQEPEKLPLIFFTHYVPIFDNCGRLSHEHSDMLCVACTGGGFSKRKHYTNSDEVIYTFRRPIILNGITPPSMEPDLIDRALIVNLDRIVEANRKTKEQVETEMNELLPYVRGYLMGIAADVMGKEKPYLPLKPRLADFSEMAEMSCRAMGYGDLRFMDVYLKMSRENERDALNSDVMGSAILEFLDGYPDGWEGSPIELHKLLVEANPATSKSPNWAKDPIRLSERIFGALRPGLAQLGWNISRIKTNGVRKIKFWKLDVNKGVNRLVGVNDV